MPLAPGITLSARVAHMSRPNSDPVPVDRVAFGSQGHRPRPRNGPDGTVWCISCETTISARQSFCPKHKVERQALARQRYAAGQVPHQVMSAIETLMVQVANYDRALGQALRAVRRENGRTPPWIDDLMIASKDMLNATEELARIHSASTDHDDIDAVAVERAVPRRTRPTRT